MTRSHGLAAISVALTVASLRCGYVDRTGEHCWRARGDATCAERHPGEEGEWFCTRDDEPCFSLTDEWGCAQARPNSDVCYSPCGGGKSLEDDDACEFADGETGDSGGDGDGDGDPGDGDPGTETDDGDGDPGPMFPEPYMDSCGTDAGCAEGEISVGQFDIGCVMLHDWIEVEGGSIGAALSMLDPAPEGSFNLVRVKPNPNGPSYLENSIEIDSNTVIQGSEVGWPKVEWRTEMGPAVTVASGAEVYVLNIHIENDGLGGGVVVYGGAFHGDRVVLRGESSGVVMNAGSAHLISSFVQSRGQFVTQVPAIAASDAEIVFEHCTVKSASDYVANCGVDQMTNVVGLIDTECTLFDYLNSDMSQVAYSSNGNICDLSMYPVNLLRDGDDDNKPDYIDAANGDLRIESYNSMAAFIDPTMPGCEYPKCDIESQTYSQIEIFYGADKYPE